MSLPISHATQKRHVFTAGWERFHALPWWGQCLALWLAVWAALTGVGITTARVAELSDGYRPEYGVPADSLPGIWDRFDATIYLGLAYQGYAAHPEAMGFFPLYPMLIVGLASTTGLSMEISALVIAQVSYLAAVLGLYKLARLLRDEHGYAMRCVVSLLIFPSSFFFFALYAESLALAFSILAVHLLLRPRPRRVWAGAAMGLAAVARPTGILLNMVPVAEFIRRRKFDLPNLMALGIGLILSVSGIVLFVYYLYTLTHSFMAIPEAQTAWGRQWQYPWITVWRSLSIAVTGRGLRDDWFMYAINGSDLLFTSLALMITGVAAWRSYRRQFPWSVSLYLAGALTFMLCSQGPAADPLWGMTRWVGSLFPIYLILGDLIRPKRLRWAAVAASAGLLIFFTAWWVSGRWVG